MARKYPRPATPAAAIADDAHRAMSALTDPTEEPMAKIQFTSVHFTIEIPRLAGGTKGLAVSTTKFFHTAQHKLDAIELDTASGLVRVSKGEAIQYVPLSKVERFGETLQDEAANAVAVKARAEASAVEAARVAAAAARKAEAQRLANLEAAAADAEAAALQLATNAAQESA